MVHRLVAETLVPNPENKPEVHHKDANPFNHHPSNLEWVTRKENIQEMYRMSGLGPTRNQVPVNLYYKDVFIKKFDNTIEACRYAAEGGCSLTSLEKYKICGDFRIEKCND